MSEGPNAPAAPPGFRLLPITEGFIATNGPLWGRVADDGRLTLGLRVQEKHCNFSGICHGGMLMTFADMVLALGSNWALGGQTFMPTISLNGDFVSSAKLGSWLEGTGRMIKATSNFTFADALITADGAPCLRVSGTNKIRKGDSPAPNLKKLLGLLQQD